MVQVLGNVGKMEAARRVWIDESFQNRDEAGEGGAMSDKQRKDEETEVEGHLVGRSIQDEPAADEEDDEVEAHLLLRNIRMD